MSHILQFLILAWVVFLMVKAVNVRHPTAGYAAVSLMWPM